MPQTPRRNSQTTPNWAEHLSANRYAAGAAVAALLAAYVVAGRGEPQRAPIPPGATLVTGLEALAPPRPKGAAPLGGKWPLDVLLVPGYERPPTCDCQLQLDARERCAADKCEQFHDEQWRRGRARCESLAQAGQCRTNSNHMYKECAEACVKREPCIDLRRPPHGPRHRRDACSMALVKNCRAYPTHVIAEKGLQHPTHWLISTQVRALEAWVHLFPFREAHTHTCIAPHGLYRSGEYDDEASELRHRRERLLALRQKRAADGV